MTTALAAPPAAAGAEIAEDVPWLGIIMPTYRGERWMGAALQSIAGQACPGLDIIVVDSSPTAATREIVGGFADRLALRVFERPDLPMWHAKTNFAARLSRAPYLCWLHQDDLWLPGRIGAIRRWIAEAPETVLHLAPSLFIDSNGRRLGSWTCPLPAERDIPPNLLAERLLVQNFVSAPAPIFQREAWLACGGLDEALWYTADWDVWLKLAAIGPVRYHTQATTAFRVHGGSLTITGRRDAAQFAEQMQIVLDRYHPAPGAIRRTAEASVAVNIALAGASVGNLGLLPAALCKCLALGPAGWRRFLRDSRIIERVAARLRALLAGGF